tara:strand:- start:46235 stop:47824 length:1590 start_codon:yes stop_codon:yes gene_type:complete
VASHLTVTSKAPAGITTTKALNAQGTAETEPGVMGAFAAMLGGGDKAADTKADGSAKPTLSLSAVADLIKGIGWGKDTQAGSEDPEAVAAVIDATAPIETTDEAKALLTDLVNGLANLKQAIDAGETVDPELLTRINEALEGLSAKFNIDLSATAGLDDLTALTTAIVDGDGNAAAQLTQALAPLAQTMLAGEAGPAASAELSAIVKSVGEKLVALLQQLNSGAVSADALAAMGLQADDSFDADLQAALAKLVNPAPKLETSAATQSLAAPALKLTEPTLTGKADASGTTAPAATSETTEGAEADIKLTAAATGNQSDAETGDRAGDKPAEDKKPIDAKAPAATPVAAATDAERAEAQAATQAAPQAVRIDAVATRAVQPGYQTSQQQLNLPQLAFELVRQVNEGNTRFQMRLDPPELGRIDVRLDIDKAGQINARLVVEKSETLDLMQRDQRALEKALQQAGLDGAKTNLEFSLKQNPFSGGQQQGRDDQGQKFSLNGMGAGDIEEAPPPTVNLYRGSLTASGVNIIA